MSTLYPDKLHVTFAPGVSHQGPIESRRYTLTHSDRTGDLFLTVASEYDRKQIGGWYTRLMRDEVLAEWRRDMDSELEVLHIYCHVSGGLALGPAGWRYGIFQQHLRQVIQAFRYGDRQLFDGYPELDDAQVLVHFAARQRRYRRTEPWGRIGDYVLGANRQRA